MSMALNTPSQLREYREGSGVLLGDLAAELGINETTLSRIERGRRALPADLPKRYRATVITITRNRYRFARGKQVA